MNKIIEIIPKNKANIEYKLYFSLNTNKPIKKTTKKWIRCHVILTKIKLWKLIIYDRKYPIKAYKKTGKIKINFFFNINCADISKNTIKNTNKK